MKRECRHHPRASRGFGSLIEIMIVAVLILGGTLLYMGMMGGPGSVRQVQQQLDNKPGTPGVSEPQSLPARAIQKARGDVCREILANCASSS